MPVLSTRAHGAIDYLDGLFLAAVPGLLGSPKRSAARRVPMALGAAAIGYSLLTRYELGAVPLIPMPMHLAIDVVHALALASSPWIFGFADEVHLPYLALGLAELGIVALTRTGPDPAGRPA